MQRDRGRLTIHTAVRPDTILLTPKKQTKQHIGKRIRISRNRLTHGERLLRNTAICCALMMGLMGLKGIDTPWSKRVAQTVSGAVSMHIDLDETLGRLNFVRNWMPDTALVFWNMGSADTMASPVTGAMTHAYSDSQPWLEYQVSGEQPVYAVNDGTVAALSQNSRGEWTMLIDHEGDEQSVYAYLGKAIVANGQQVKKGQQIAVTQDQDAAKVYFELRVNGIAADPTDRMSGK